MNCPENIIPVQIVDDCGGKTVKAGCVIDSNAYTLLEISANSTQQEINIALVLALNAANTRLNALELLVVDLEERLEILEP